MQPSPRVHRFGELEKGHGRIRVLGGKQNSRPLTSNRRHGPILACFITKQADVFFSEMTVWKLDSALRPGLVNVLDWVSLICCTDGAGLA